MRNHDDAPRSKQSQYDGGLRTPIMVRWKGKLAPQMSETPVSSLDLFPTILNVCGVTAPKDLPGVDLLNGTTVSARQTIFGECFTHNAIDLDHPTANLRWRWVLDDGWKLILPAAPNETGPPELFHISEDPHEEHDRTRLPHHAISCRAGSAWLTRRALTARDPFHPFNFTNCS